MFKAKHIKKPISKKGNFGHEMVPGSWNATCHSLTCWLHSSDKL